MPYVTAGIADLDVDGLNLTYTGDLYGLGMDYKYSESSRIGGEVLQHEFDDFGGSGLNIDATTAALPVSFDF